MSLRAGTATADITPDGSVHLFGYPRVERVSTGVHDPLLVSALHLRTGASGIVVLSMDLLALDPPTTREIRRFVAEQCHAKEESVFICCTHTHSGPVTTRMLAWQSGAELAGPEPEYLEAVKQAAAQAGAQASATSAPAEVVWLSSDATGLTGNRHAKDGVTDPEMGILAVRKDGGGELMGVLNTCSTQPSVLKEDSTEISSDFVHYMRVTLQERFGEELVVLQCAGPCADQGPRNFIQENTFAAAEMIGRGFGDRIAGALDAVADDAWSNEIAVAAKLTAVETKRCAFPSLWDAKVTWGERRAEFDRLRQEGADRAVVETAQGLLRGAEGVMILMGADQRGTLNELMASYEPVEVQVARIQDTYIAGFPGELSVAYGLKFKEGTERKVYGINLATGELQGYILTPEDAQANRYEAACTVLAPEVGDTLVEAGLSLVSEL